MTHREQIEIDIAAELRIRPTSLPRIVHLSCRAAASAAGAGPYEQDYGVGQ